ncbi:MAG: hypothetical protein M1379_16555, partial [Firmicutes bacterium]|nr:hypothetical protein [Bacillota bacterium]
MLGGSGKRFGSGKRWGTAKRWVLLALILGLSGAVLFGVPGGPGLAGGPGVALARGIPAEPGLMMEEPVIEVLPVAVHAGGNTDPSFPARHLIDSDATSFWQTTATTPKEAWFSLELDRPYRIQTIELTGLWGTAGTTGNPAGNPAGQVEAADLAIQYESGGFWHTFMGRGHVNGRILSQGPLRIDLSYNQAIASKLRLVFANPRNAPRLGGITNIRVWGSQPVVKSTRLNPVSISQSANTLPNHPGTDLADGNTYTGWQASPVWPLWPASGWNQPGWVVLDLGRPYEIDQVRLFGQAGGITDSTDGSGRFAVEYEVGGAWQPFSGLNSVENKSLGSHWSRFDFSAQRIVTSRVRVYVPVDLDEHFDLPEELDKFKLPEDLHKEDLHKFKSPEDLHHFLKILEEFKRWPREFGPAELELWGREADGGTVAASRLGLAPQGPSAWLGAGAVFSATVELPGDLALNTYTQARLHYEVENLTAATQLLRRVNGGKYLPVKAAPQDGRWQAVSETIDVAELRPGKNFVNFQATPAAAGGTASPLRVDNLQLELIRPDGEIQPVAIEGSPETDPAYPAANLMDGQAGTTWQSLNTWPAQAQVELDLGTGYLLDRLELLPVAGYNRDVTVEYLPAEPATSLPGALPGPGGPANRPDANNQGNWQPLPGASHLDLGLFGEGWVSLDLTGKAGVGQTGATQPVVAQKLRLVFVNTDSQAMPAALKEIRLWGSRVNTAPSVWILSPKEGEFLRDDEAMVSGKVDNPLVQVTVNGKSKHVTRLDNLFTARIELKKEKEQEEDGEELSHPKHHPWRATITAMATDSLGRQGSDTVTVYPDVNEDKIPIPVITAPKDGATLAAASVAVEVTVPKDDGPVMVYVNGVQATELKGPEDDGDHKDQKAPQAPKSQEGQKDTEGYPDKEGSQDKEGPKVRAFTAQVPLEEGLNRLEATVVTQRGYQRTGAITIFNDTLPPVVRLNTPLAGDVLAGSVLAVRGMAGDTTQLGVQVNGLPAAWREGIFSDSLNLVEGPNLLTITATDAFKRATTQKVGVMVDSQPPVVRIDFPAREAILTAEPVTVTGSVQDATPTSVFVNGVTAAAISGSTANGRFAAQVHLSEGWNTLRAVAFDAAEHPASDTLQVLLDTQPPLPFAPVADPAGWTPVPTPIITFATTDVTSGMDHYELKVDDGAYVTVMSPYTLPPLADGIHAITVKAVDRAGWETFGTVKVYIDATPPAAFTPVADPAGWTSQTTPTITFATTDATSGIDHYELKVGNEAFAVVTSPHTLPAQPDGEQVVTVRAVDKAGNVTEGQTKICIDTIPPGLPTGLELIPGPDSITAKWQPNPEEDVIHYLLRREPAFSDGTATRTITREQGTSYKDLDVTPGSSYAYQLQAVDHAQNA